MLTQDSIRDRLNHIANELAHEPGIYYELYSRKFSERVQHWMRSASGTEAALIEQVAQNDPDFLATIVVAAPDALDIEIAATIANPQREPLFNPDWDVSY